MRVKGKEVKGCPVKPLVLRPDDGPDKIVLMGKALQNWDEFNKLCPHPTPPQMTTAKDGVVNDSTNKDYLSVLAAYVAAQNAYVFVKTLEPSEIEWAYVKMDQPSTWVEWQRDLKEGNFTELEIKRISDFVIEVNNLDEEKLRKAREVFQQGMDQ